MQHRILIYLLNTYTSHADLKGRQGQEENDYEVDAKTGRSSLKMLHIIRYVSENSSTTHRRMFCCMSSFNARTQSTAEAGNKKQGDQQVANLEQVKFILFELFLFAYYDEKCLNSFCSESLLSLGNYQVESDEAFIICCTILMYTKHLI